MFSVNVMEPDAPQKMAEWHKKGCTGMRIFARGSTIKTAWLALDDPATAPAWKCAADLGISVVTNVHAKAEALGQLRAILTTYPGVKLVLDHMGQLPAEDGPPYAAAAEVFKLAKFPNFFLKFTNTGIDLTVKGKATPGTLIQKVISEFGANRIMWGSNYPSAKGSLSEIVARSRALLSDVSDKDKDWILSKTAQAVYPALKD